MTGLKRESCIAWIACLITVISCKPRMFSVANTKSLTATHVMQAEFKEANGKISYSFVGADADQEEIKAVKVSQLKSSDKAVFYKGKINENFLMGYDQEKKFYPHYALEVVTRNLNCRSLDSAWMGSKEIELNCVKSSSSPQQTNGENNGSVASPSSPQSTSPSGRSPSPPPQGNQTVASATVPPSAAECSGAKIRSYAVCRFFEGGHYGCYEKHRCITRMTSSKCSSTKADLKKQYPWMASRWDCSAGVAP